MHPILEILEQRGLVSPDQINETIRRLSIPKLEELHEKLREALLDEKHLASNQPAEDQLGSFKFLASLSFSGVDGCIAPPCRAAQARTLAAYAALYADNVVVPLPLEQNEHIANDEWSEVHLRLSLIGTLLSIWEMRPAIDAGLIELTAPELHFCQECAAKAMRELKRVDAAAKRMARIREGEFSLTYDCSRSSPRIGIHGPTDVVEHGEIFQVLRQPPEWAPKARRPTCVTTLSKSRVRQSRVVERLFQRIGYRVGLQQLLAARHDAKTLTSSPGELALLENLDEQGERASRIATSLSRITHNLPLLGGISVASAVRLRHEEGEAFDVYRKALRDLVGSLVEDSNILSESKAAEIVGDVLQPELAKLQQLQQSSFLKFAKQARTWLLASAALLTLGFTGGLTAEEMAILTAGACLPGLIGSLAGLQSASESIRNQNFYYLLRLTQ
jgi:hypothetical protein